MNIENGCALLIGLDYDEDASLRLKYGKKDASDIRNCLITSGYDKSNTELLTGDTIDRKRVMKAFNRLNENLHSDSLFIFFFSGHGFAGEKKNAFGEKEDIYRLLLPNYSDDNEDTYLSKGDILNLFHAIKSNNVLFLVDSCRSGVLAREKGKRDIDSDECLNEISSMFIPDENKMGRVLIAGSSPGMNAYEIDDLENGIFTHCLLNGLKGAGQDSTTYYVKVMDLLKYMLNEVPLVAAKNKQNQRSCIKTSFLCDDFSICKKVFSNKKYPVRFIDAVWDIGNEDRGIIEGLSALSRNVAPILDSSIAYKEKESTNAFINFAADRDYPGGKTALDLIKAHRDEILDNVIDGEEKPLRIISLGIGDGKKDGEIIKSLLNKFSMPIEYCVVDKSRNMARKGINYVRTVLDNKNAMVDIIFVDADFQELDNKGNYDDQDERNEFNVRFGNDRVNLILLLGNTLGNFQESPLLNTINSIMHPGDWLLIDNQLKKPGKLSAKEEQALIDSYGSDNCMNFLYAILKGAGIERNQGTIKPVIESKIDYVTVREQFTANEEFQIPISGTTVHKNTTFTILYSKKYTIEYMKKMITDSGLNLVKEPYTDKGKEYALILARKK
jgi:uncharacterized SAM-dependent methyltransferase